MRAAPRFGPLPHRTLTLLWLPLLLSCTQEPAPRPIGTVEAALTMAERRARATEIRDIAAAAGLPTAGLLLAGIANAETGLAHCWSEATWACQGPTSSYCGGPVIAGAADGPCSDRQGGLGMFQFDAGTYEDTLRREGNRILELQGNIEAAIDFVASMVVRSTYINGVESRDRALAWMNGVRPDNDRFDPWIRTVVHYYNGCVPGRCSVYNSRYDRYRDKTLEMLDLMGRDFWYGEPIALDCPRIPAEGGIVDDADACFEKFGPTRFWRRVDGVGVGAGLWWTNAFRSAEPSNWARWRFGVEAAGRYRIEVNTVADYSRWNAVRYRVTHAGGTSDLEVDLAGSDGWTPLGAYDFAPDGLGEVAVYDHAGVDVPADSHITADAIRLVPLDVPTPMDDGGVEPPPGLDGGSADPDAGAVGPDAGGWEEPDAAPPVELEPVDRRGVEGGCACRLGPHPAGSTAAAAWVLLGLAWLNRRRRG